MRWLSPKRWLKLILLAAVLGVAAVVAINVYIHSESNSFTHERISDIPTAPVAIVLGAHVLPNGKPTPMLADRVDAGYRLYHTGKVKKLLLSGDHGKTAYDEVNVMRKLMLEHDVPPEDIFLDHAGFDTYDSLYRARDVFGIRSATVVTQRFHLPRAIYTGRQLGIETHGYVADRRRYDTTTNNARELLANAKAFPQIVTGAKPRLLGSKIPIAGDGRASWDEGL